MGDIGTGKTSFVKRVKYDMFEEKVPPTVGVDFLVKRIKWDPTTEVQVQIWWAKTIIFKLIDFKVDFIFNT